MHSGLPSNIKQQMKLLLKILPARHSLAFFHLSNIMCRLCEQSSHIIFTVTEPVRFYRRIYIWGFVFPSFGPKKSDLE